MKVDIDEVWDMECKEFFKRLKHLEAVLAEERYILQRQIDNQLKTRSKKTVNSFGDIYREFSKQMETVREIVPFEMTDEQKRKIHEENLKKMGLR